MARTPMTGPTLASIAEHAGVSVATVSKVVNGRQGMSEATRARVEAAVRELGYRPAARSGGGGARQIHVVFDTLHSVYSLRVLDGMVAAAQRLDIDLVTRVLSPASGFGIDGATGDEVALDRAFVAATRSTKARSA
jgi:LacI family transcriptional regulator